MAQFMILIHNCDDTTHSADEMQSVVEQYMAWAQKLGSEGRMLGGDALFPGGKTIRGLGSDRKVLDGPFAESKEAIGGYFLFKAEDEKEAIEVASGCPGLKWGAALELRQIDSSVA